MKNLLTTIACICSLTIANAAPVKTFSPKHSLFKDSIVRKKLLLAQFPVRNLSSVDVREISFQPGQKTGRHMHPIPVMGYIVSGSVLFQIDGQPSKILHAGDAFYEPAQTPIIHFDNVSGKENLKFIAYYLLNGETELIQMLPEGK